jgi:hypothetical protein
MRDARHALAAYEPENAKKIYVMEYVVTISIVIRRDPETTTVKYATTSQRIR